MLPQPQVNATDTRAFIGYIRELQVANGISHEPHRMR